MSIFSKLFHTMKPVQPEEIPANYGYISDGFGNTRPVKKGEFKYMPTQGEDIIITEVKGAAASEQETHVITAMELLEMEADKRRTFFDTIRTTLFGGKLSTSQVAGITAIINEWDKRELQDKRWLAYILGSVYWESARTMKPIEEIGKGKDYYYGKPDSRTGKTYYGRGRIQLTLYDNYLKFEKLLNVPLTTHPELMLTDAVDLPVLFMGMIDGLYTGKKLYNYFNDLQTDWLNARKIVNPNDKKTYKIIEDVSIKFYSAL